jgi:hypothetical protein
LSTYHEARVRGGEKHSAAIREVVSFLKRRNPDIHISETEVKRTLAKYWPKGTTVLRFERKELTEEDLNRHRSILERLATLSGHKNLSIHVPTVEQLSSRASLLTIRFGERPIYRRHNGKVDG